ncbi:hypothetical protein ACFV4X_26375 [Streptomyces ardesiacus]|uniref:hypothetical protein n=1 Tax=Streptomyces ardesiacus TaxID=285564 RepID=UPI0036490842
MNRTVKTWVTVLSTSIVVGTSRGGFLLAESAWLEAAIAYGASALCTVGLIHEIGYGITSDVEQPAPVKEAGPLARIRAARTARRVTRSIPCTCDRYWTTAGREHDPWCPEFYRSFA